MSDLHSLVSKYAGQARIAREHDKVYKDECVYTFDTAESNDGLFICLNTFIAVSKPYLPIHYAKNHTNLYLHMKIYRKEVN
jgi:ubiquitin carboxyl-terminal hydrolase 5/13